MAKKTTYLLCLRLSYERTFFSISLFAIPENLGLEKSCHHDSLWHFTLFLFRFGINVKDLHIVCTLFSAGGLNLQPNFQKGGGGLTGPQLLEGVFWETGGDFFQGAWQFSHTKNLKSEIVNNKKIL